MKMNTLPFEDAKERITKAVHEPGNIFVIQAIASEAEVTLKMYGEFVLPTGVKIDDDSANPAIINTGEYELVSDVIDCAIADDSSIYFDEAMEDLTPEQVTIARRTPLNVSIFDVSVTARGDKWCVYYDVWLES